MRRKEKIPEKLNRKVAIVLSVCVAVVVGMSFLLLQATVWRLGPEPPEPFYTDLPDVDMKGVPAGRLEGLLKQLNTRHCPCDCMRTIAGCRNHHRSCGFSLSIARQAVTEAPRR